MEKNDLSWSEKLKYILYVLRYSKQMAKWAMMNCEYCGSYKLVLIDKQINNGAQKEFQKKYKCLHCGATVTQIWECEKNETNKRNNQ